MRVAEPVLQSGWRAELELGYERRGGRTVLARRRHEGPLVVQKPLYPEGDEVCHTLVVHPPAGVAGGDTLDIAASLGAQARALLTTPGAGKWYRSAGAQAAQRVALRAGDGAVLEWLPQETIVYDGALADLSLEVDLEGGAAYLGWDIVCLGRTGSGERFARGRLRLRTSVRRDGRLAWLERGTLEGGGALGDSPAGLGGQPVFGTLIASGGDAGAALLAACREQAPREGECAVTRLPGVLVARYLGASSEAARHYFAELWRLLRPAVAGREADPPRIWRT